MAYALFEDGLKLSNDFDSFEEAWRHAEEAGLTDMVGDKVVLAGNYRTAHCDGDHPEAANGETEDTTEKADGVVRHSPMRA